MLDFLRRHALITAALSFACGLALWRKIELPYANPADIFGPLSLADFHPANNLLRYLTVTLFPGLVYALLRAPVLFQNKSTGTAGEKVHSFWFYVSLLAVLPLIYGHAAYHLRFSSAELDFLHEGELLSPAFHASQGLGLWTGSFFIHGLFYDVLASRLAWNFWGAQSIGAMRLAGMWENAFVGIGFAGAGILLALVVRKIRGAQSAALFLSVWLLVYYAGYDGLFVVTFRDIPFLLFAVLFLASFASKQIHWSALCGLVIPWLFLVTIEKGGYAAAVSGGCMALSVFLKSDEESIGLRIRRAALFGAGIVVGAAGVLLVLGRQEFLAFIENLVFWVRYRDYLDAFVFPRPWGLASIHQAIPVSVITAVSLAFVWVLAHRERFDRWTVLAGAFFWLAALVSFRSGLGRSDVPHIQYASGFAYLAAGCFVWMIWQKQINRVVPFPLIFAAMVALIYVRFPHLPPPAIPAGETAAAFVQRPDSDFILPAARDEYERIKAAMKDQPCAGVYVESEAAWPYLLKKPSCSRFFFVWFAAAREHQRQFIEDLERKKPGLILSAPASVIDGIPNSMRYPLIESYLREKYRTKWKSERYVMLERI